MGAHCFGTAEHRGPAAAKLEITPCCLGSVTAEHREPATAAAGNFPSLKLAWDELALIDGFSAAAAAAGIRGDDEIDDADRGRRAPHRSIHVRDTPNAAVNR